MNNETALRSASHSSLRSFYSGIMMLYGADALLIMVVRWGVAANHGSPFLLSATYIFPLLPQLAAGVFGVERVGGRRSIRATVLLGSVMVGAAAIVSFLTGIGALPSLLLGAALLGGWADAIAVPKAQTTLMQALPTQERVRGSRNFEIASRLPSLAAPIAGGVLLVALGVRPALAGVAVLLLLAAMFFHRIDNAQGEPARAQAEFAIRRSLAVIRRDRWLATALAVRGLSNLAWPAYAIALPLLVLDRLHGGAGGYAVLLWVYAASMLTSAALSGRLKRAQLRRIYFVSWIVTGSGFLVAALAPGMPLAAAGVALAGAGSPYVHMALDTHIGTEVAPEDQTALFSFQRLVISAMSIIGSLFAGTMLLSVSPAGAIAAAGTTLAAAGLAGGLAAAIGSVRSYGAREFER
jgi:MFS family permease